MFVILQLKQTGTRVHMLFKARELYNEQETFITQMAKLRGKHTWHRLFRNVSAVWKYFHSPHFSLENLQTFWMDLLNSPSSTLMQENTHTHTLLWPNPRKRKSRVLTKHSDMTLRSTSFHFQDKRLPWKAIAHKAAEDRRDLWKHAFTPKVKRKYI